MTAAVLDGRIRAAHLRSGLRARVRALVDAGAAQPHLATILVGEDEASRIYVAAKHRDCAEVGIGSVRIDLPATATTAEVCAAIAALNEDPRVAGLIVQLPLPSQVDPLTALLTVEPAKDADGLHPVNLGRLVLDRTGPVPCTPRGILDLLTAHGVDLSGACVVIVGRGTTVGRPLSLLLTSRGVDATVTICHTGTRNLAAITRRADVIVAATGRPGVLTADMVSPGTAVVDVGITRIAGRLQGDVDPGVAAVAGLLTPVPGGIGPMTRVMLLDNVVTAAGG